MKKSNLEFKFLIYIIVSSFVISQVFGCIHLELNKTDKEKIDDINELLNDEYTEFQFTDDLAKKYDIEKSIGKRFKNKDLTFIEDNNVRSFVEDCIVNISN